MKKEARQILEYVVKKLDEGSQPPEKGSWKEQVEKETKPEDVATLRQTYVYLNLIMTGQQATDDAIGKTLVGENILTPALTNKGWQFWKPLSVTDKEKEAVNSAVINWSREKVAKLDSLRETYENLPDTDLRSQVNFIASVLDINASCKRQLSDDLKMILRLS